MLSLGFSLIGFGCGGSIAYIYFKNTNYIIPKYKVSKLFKMLDSFKGE